MQNFTFINWNHNKDFEKITPIKKLWKKHTLPHEDLGCSFAAVSPLNSSANPQEQSLQAFRFPVVPHTKIKNFFYSTECTNDILKNLIFIKQI